MTDVPPATTAPADPAQRFADRRAAGRALAAALRGLHLGSDPLVLGLPRGGVPVAYEVAHALGAELDVLVVRKLGVPQQPELAMGAIAAGGVIERNPGVIAQAGVGEQALREVLAREQKECLRREQVYRGDRPPPRLQGRTVLVVDDGVATGATMRAALAVLRRAGAQRLVVATPVAPAGLALELGLPPQDVVVLLQPRNFGGVGSLYQEFGQTGDEEVRGLLARMRAERC